MTVLIDNIGAIKMLDLKTTKCGIKHMDTRFHWIREYLSNDFVKVRYVKWEDNILDICTKNLSVNLHKKHLDKLILDVVF